MTATDAMRGVIPAHVPPHLVRDIPWYGLEEPSGDTNGALVELRGDMDIFYIPQNDRNPYGTWVLTRFADIQKAFSDSEHFTTNHIAGFNILSGIEQLLIPIEFDPPDHRKYRAVMNPYFSRERLEAHRGVMEAAVDGVIDQIIDAGEADVVPWGFRMMAPIWCAIMGAPADQAEDYIRLMFGFTHQYDPAIRFQNARDMLVAMQALYATCKDHGSGMIHGFIHSEIDGRMPTESECGGFILFMFLAGIDTMGATTAWLLRHLALHPELRRNLIAHPERRGAFLEEGFRRYAVVSTNRFVKRDVEMCGVLLKQGDNVLVSAPFANMDAIRFDSPKQFDPDRKGRHLTFGAGAHFCIGAQLARMQLPIMLDRWLERIPDFEIKAGAQPTAHFGDVMALNTLPLIWPSVTAKNGP